MVITFEISITTVLFLLFIQVLFVTEQTGDLMIFAKYEQDLRNNVLSQYYNLVLDSESDEYIGFTNVFFLFINVFWTVILINVQKWWGGFLVVIKIRFNWYIGGQN